MVYNIFSKIRRKRKRKISDRSKKEDYLTSYLKIDAIERWEYIVNNRLAPPHIHELRARWVDKNNRNKPIVTKIANALRKGEDFRPLLKDIPFVEEIDNRKDLRGINLSSQLLLCENTAENGKISSYVPLHCPGVDFSFADLSGTDLRGAEFGSYTNAYVDLNIDYQTIAYEGVTPDTEEEFKSNKPSRFYFAKFFSSQLMNANFYGCDCFAAHFDHADMRGTSFWHANCQNCSFIESNLESANLRSAKLQNALWENTNLDWARVDYDTEFGKKLEGSEFSSNPEILSDMYRRVKTLFRDAGLYSKEDDYFYLEMKSRRKCRRGWHPLRWFEFILVDLTCGYGVKPIRTIISIFSIILICGILFWVTKLPLNSYHPNLSADFSDSVYFSIVTFTTLGFGDWFPNPDSPVRFLASIEALLGALFISLSIVTFARKSIRTGGG